MTKDNHESIHDDRFRELLRRAIMNDPEACETIVKEYGSHIMRAVRRHMNQAIRDRADSEDFAQAVWASFFGHISVVRDMKDERQLAGFLAGMARNKVIDAGRRRKVRKEKNSGGADEIPVVKDYRRLLSQPTPSEFAMANEKWSHLKGTSDEKEKELLELKVRYSGDTQAETARRFRRF